MNILGWVLIILFIFIFISYLVIFYCQKKLFQPTVDTRWIPDIPFENWMINDSIHAWYFQRKQSKGTVLFCHGNYGNITYRSYIIGLFLKAHLNVIVFDYNGFGFSKGEASTGQICENGLNVYDYMTRVKNIHENIIICGESLGGSVAAYITKHRTCSQLILLSTFSSLPKILEDKTQGQPYFQFLITLYSIGAKDTHLLNTKEWIKDQTIPLLVIHSSEDDMIPFSHAQEIYDSSSSAKKQLIEIKGGHSSPKFSDEELKQLFHFCLSGSLKDPKIYQAILDKGLKVYHNNTLENNYSMNVRDYLTNNLL